MNAAETGEMIEPAVSSPGAPVSGVLAALPAAGSEAPTADAKPEPEVAAQAALSLSGPLSVAVGSEITMTVEINDIGPLFSAPLFISYDTARLEFVGATEGTFLNQGGQKTVFSVSPNPAAGQVVVGYKLAGQAGGMSGSGVLFRMAFRGKAPGAARIELHRMNFRDAAGAQLEVAPATAVIAIQ
jgi:general secretion pathway protein D